MEMILGNSTAGSTENDTSVTAYMMYLYPIAMSCGLGGSIIGAVYFVLNYLVRKITSKMWSTITISYEDQSFKIILKYLIDKNLLSDDNVLNAKVK